MGRCSPKAASAREAIAAMKDKRAAQFTPLSPLTPFKDPG